MSHPPARTARARRLIVGLALALVALAWLTTLQTDITAGNDSLTDPSGLVDPLMDDSGEFVVAWYTWGVTHPPGYPLQNLVGNLVAQSLAALGIPPAAAASLVSFSFALAALALIAALVWPYDARGPATAAALLLPAFGGLVWLYAAVAEVYALGLCLALTAICLALYAGAHADRRWPILALGLAFGLAVGHHRTLLALLPALAVAAWPARRQGRAWLGAGLLAVLSLAVYAYLPLAATAGSPWIYGRSPATLDGFLDAVLAREYGAQLAPPTTPAAIAIALTGRLTFLAAEMTPAGLILGLLGLVLGLAHADTRRPAAVVGLAACGYLLAPVGQYLVIGTHLLIMVASAVLAAAWGIGLAAWTRERAGLAWLGLGVSVLVAGYAHHSHRPEVVTLAQDPNGRQLIDAVAALPGAGPSNDMPAGAFPIVVESWSPRLFALAYGKWVTGELSSVRLVGVRADLAGLSSAASLPGALPGVLYTTPHMLYLAPLDRWTAQLGGSAALESAGDALIAIRRAPRMGAEPDSPPAGAEPGSMPSQRLPTASNTDPDVTLADARAWRVENGDIRLTLEWQAARPPRQDYHVFVQATDRPQVTGPDDILAQADREHPVYGFYPTSRWGAGERVRDDYRIVLPPGLPAERRPTRVEVGLYTVGADGAFADALRESVPIESVLPAAPSE
jgi:hypothetical protein